MSKLQTVAVVTNNRKDNHFLLFSTYLLPFLDLASVKYLETRQSCENDFRQYFNLKKWKIYLGDFLKSYNFIFLIKRRNPYIKFCQKITLWSRHLYHETYKLSKNFTEGNTRKVSTCFLCLHVCDVIQFWNDHARMRINGPLASLAHLRRRRIVLISYVLSSSYFCEHCDTFLEMKI